MKRLALSGSVFAMATALAVAAASSGALAQEPTLSPSARNHAKDVYFQRCAGCHGVLRKGATGKNLEPDNTKKLGQSRLERIISLGTDGGMVNFDDILTKDEIRDLASYVQLPPDIPPEWGIKQMTENWKLIVPPEQRPKQPMNKINLKNVFSVTLRDTGEVALIDGDTKKIWTIVKTGYAVHISRLSYSGRYVYTIGRDGLTSLIDLWMETPQVVATLKAGSDARSIDTSKFKGYEDKYAIIGTYWPPQYVVTEGDTLKPLKIVSTRGITVDGEYHPEPRVASIVSSQIKPEWVVNVKEAGMILLVDYSDIRNLKTTTIEAAKFLHDGGWDASKRYFLVAANAVHKIAVVDTKEGKLAALIDTKKIPHPGRGANFVHPRFGPVWATGHLGDAVVTLIGTDPDKNQQHAWKVVEELKIAGAGNLFVKTHPKSTNMWADLPQNPERDLAESVFVYDLRDLSKPARQINVAKDSGLPETKAVRRAVHPEYNEAGDEVWISVWAGKTDPSAIVVYDDKTLRVKAVIKDPRVITPTGKFNVYNTKNDVY